jgi:secondary thiamine-phosphate synthase enzyme
MLQALERLAVETSGRGLFEVTNPVARWVGARRCTLGLLTVFCPHTSASLLVQENADPDVRTDLESFFERLAPERRGLYRHDAEGPDDMPAHIRAALTQSQLSIPVERGRLQLGRRQGLYLFEHRTHPHRRQLLLHLQGDSTLADD